MADADLAELRAARLAQLKQQGPSSGSNSGAGNNSQQQDKAQAESEARASILSQILEPEAADRLARIRLVKASRAEDVENRLITLARSGQLRAKVSETQLKELLGAVAETREEEKIVVSRRRGWEDDELDDLLDES